MTRSLTCATVDKKCTLSPSRFKAKMGLNPQSETDYLLPMTGSAVGKGGKRRQAKKTSKRRPRKARTVTVSQVGGGRRRGRKTKKKHFTSKSRVISKTRKVKRRSKKSRGRKIKQ
jgi:hypothetical protein